MAREVGRSKPLPMVLALLRRVGLFLWLSARLILGWAFIALGILGAILPVLPGMPFLIIGTLLLGRHSRLARRASVGGKRLLRRWAADERPAVRAAGRWALRTQRDTSCRLRRVTWWLAARQRAWGRRLRGA